MRKFLMVSLWVIPALIILSCTENNSLQDNGTSGNSILLQIKSVIADNNTQDITKGTITEFPDGDTIGLYLHEYRSGNAFPYAVHENHGWRMSEPVFLGNEPVRLLAYYPYRHKEHAFLSAKEVNVEHTSQTDYMHGQAEGDYVSRNKPYAGIVMKHSLALVQFKFIKNDYPHGCSVQRVSIQNTDGITHLGSRGILNLESGEVRVLEGYYDGATLIPEDMNFYKPYTGEEEYARILVMPVGPVRKEGDLSFEFEIDGRSYTYPVKAGTAWKSGMKYTYEVEMAPGTKSSGTSCIPGNISVVLTGAGKNR